MTDGNTDAINKPLNDQEDFDALQEAYTELEQAEAENKKYHDAWLEAEAKVVELEAKLKAKEKLMLALAGDKIDLVSELAGVKGKLEEALELSDAGMVGEAGDHLRTTLAELKGQDDE